MHLLIGFVVLLCLVCSELQTAQVATDLGWRIVAVALFGVSVPGVAFFQSLLIYEQTNTDDEEARREQFMRRLSVSTLIIWGLASFAIVWFARWHDVVRGNWNLDRFPLVDEALILLPVLGSLIASWFVIHDIQHRLDQPSVDEPTAIDERSVVAARPAKPRTSNGSAAAPSGSFWRSRLEFVAIRIRVYLLLILIPLTIAILGRDLAPWLGQFADWQAASIGTAACLLIAAGFPTLLMWLWRTGEVGDPALRAELARECQQQGLNVAGVKIWRTGSQIVNALVVGMLPNCRYILLSDLLVERFTQREVLAVVRHEAGHVNLYHLPIRIGFTLLPLAALVIDESKPVGLTQQLEQASIAAGLPVGSAVLMLGLCYLGYVLLALSWLSQKMESEADIYACRVDKSQEEPTAQANICSTQVDAMVDALLRVAAFAPSQLERRTLFHPSLMDRIMLLKSVQRDPELAEKFQSAFVRRRRISLFILSALVAVTVLT